MTVLVVRPQADADRTSARLAARGITAIAAPASRIVPVAATVPESCAATAITSANAVPAIAAEPRLRTLPLYAVGDRTAAAARAAGFAGAVSAGGGVGDLAAMILARQRPSDGTILYASGRDTAGDLEGRLRRAGFDVRRVVVYEAAAADALPAAAVEAVGSGRVTAVLLYSARAARLFGELAARAGLRDRLAHVPGVCLSPGVADMAKAAGFGHVRAADSPDEDALIAALEACLAGR